MTSSVNCSGVQTICELQDHFVSRKSLLQNTPKHLQNLLRVLITSIIIPLEDKLRVFRILVADADLRGLRLSDFLKKLVLEERAICWGVSHCQGDSGRFVMLTKEWHRRIELFDYLMMAGERQVNYQKAQTLALSLGIDANIDFPEVKKEFNGLPVDQQSALAIIEKYLASDLCECLSRAVPFLEIPFDEWGPEDNWQNVLSAIQGDSGATIDPLAQTMQEFLTKSDYVGTSIQEADSSKMSAVLDDRDNDDARWTLGFSGVNGLSPTSGELQNSIEDLVFSDKEEWIEGSVDINNDNISVVANMSESGINCDTEEVFGQEPTDAIVEKGDEGLTIKAQKDCITFAWVSLKTLMLIPKNDLRFNEVEFMTLLRESLSLSIDEKERIIDSLGSLSQFQIDELIKIFLKEQIDFVGLHESHRDQINSLRVTHRQDFDRMIEKRLENIELR